MALAKILIQLDSDPHASVFDAVVAVDAGAERLLQYANVQPEQVRGLVHGAMFTRGPQDLRHTAIFVGGSSVAAGERTLREVLGAFFGPMRVSVLFDANGANTTAAAAVLACTRHTALERSTAVVLGATGPVGQRVVRLLAGAGCRVRAVSREKQRAEEICRQVLQSVPQASLTGHALSEQTQALAGAEIVVAAGAAGVTLLSADQLRQASDIKLVVDLNAVPPAGIEGVDVMDKAKTRDGILCYGAIGVGGTKMKIHKAAIQRLFEANNLVLDAEQVFALGRELE